MFELVLIVDIIVAISIVALVLIQQGKGAVMGASFGAGSSNTVFGSRGSASFIFKLTVFFVTLFFCLSLLLGYMGKNSYTPSISSEQTSQQAYDNFKQKQDSVSKNNALTEQASSIVNSATSDASIG